MSTDSSEHEAPRWVLPPRKEISPENLHISSFVVVKKGTDQAGQRSILLLKAGEKHPLSFRRGKLLLPALILAYGEKPKEGAKRVLKDELKDNVGLKEPEFMTMQSYLGAHWDIIFLFGTTHEPSAPALAPKEPFVQAAFYSLDRLPRGEIAEDHLEVIDEMLNPSDS